MTILPTDIQIISTNYDIIDEIKKKQTQTLQRDPIKEKL
jgi:hypothetical protein